MSVCLLITTMNRSPQLQRSLQRLTELTHPDEVLVVDDGGSDDCEAVCAQFADRLPVRYLYNHNPANTICSFARNVGIRSTDADLVITSEPEVLFLTDVVAQMCAVRERDTASVVSAGVVYHAQADGVVDPGQCERIEGWVAPFTALYERSWLLDVGGWDESFPGAWGWDDTDLLTRLRIRGHGQIVDREIEVLHQWHTRGSTEQASNEKHFRAKGFNEGNHDHVVANRETEWGVTRAR